MFFGSAWQGQWHIPPGNSYMAHLLNDAGGDYCFSDRTSSGNIAIDLETVITEARAADRFGIILEHGGELHRIDIAGGDERIVALPVMSWWLDIGLLEALVLDLGFVLFYLVYAFVYNWSYDKVFPIPGQVQQNALG